MHEGAKFDQPVASIRNSYKTLHPALWQDGTCVLSEWVPNIYA